MLPTRSARGSPRRSASARPRAQHDADATPPDTTTPSLATKSAPPTERLLRAQGREVAVTPQDAVAEAEQGSRDGSDASAADRAAALRRTEQEAAQHDRRFRFDPFALLAGGQFLGGRGSGSASHRQLRFRQGEQRSRCRVAVQLVVAFPRAAASSRSSSSQASALWGPQPRRSRFQASWSSGYGAVAAASAVDGDDA